MSLIFSLLSLFCGLIVSYLYLSLRKSYQSNIRQKSSAILAARKINRIILEELNYENVVQKIADFLPNELQFATGIVSILDDGGIRRIAASKTREADEAIQFLKIPFNEIVIPLTDPNNLMARSVRERTSFTTDDVYDVLGPIISREDCKRVQNILGTKTTLIYPLFMENAVVGVFIASTEKNNIDITSDEREIIETFVDGAGIALQHALLYQNLSKTSKRLQGANDRLKEVDKLKDEFVSLASHELRTPMTAIKSYLWMAIAGKGGKLTEKQQYYLDRAYRSTDRLITLVNDMLNISRIESGRVMLALEEVDIVKLTREVIEEVLPHAQQLGIQVVARDNPSIPHVLADPDKIKEVLINLIGNSLKFTQRDGTIEVSFAVHDLVHITVRDSGVGIAPADLPKLFQKFGLVPGSYVITRTATQGSGLGLYLCKSIVQMHGGEIGAASEGIGKGTTVTFSLRRFDKRTLEDYYQRNPQPEHAVELVPTRI